MARADDENEVHELENGDGDGEGDDDDDDDAGELIDGEEDEMNPLVHLPDYVVKRVEKLKEIDVLGDSIMDEYLKERAALEQKFAAKMKPLREERRAIVEGSKDAEIASATGVFPPSEGENNGDGQAPVVKGVPHFWVTAISNHESTGELLTEEDVDCLEHLVDVICIDDADGKGFTIKFVFAPNDYFVNTELTKRYEVPNLLLSDEPLIKQVQGCVIHWKDEDHRCLTHRKFQKKQRGKGKKAGQVRTITKTEKKESFFHWFTAPKMPASVENMDEEEVEEIEEQFTDDFEVAQAFRCEICPRAVLWYTGEAAEREMLEMMEAAGVPDGDNE